MVGLNLEIEMKLKNDAEILEMVTGFYWFRWPSDEKPSVVWFNRDTQEVSFICDGDPEKLHKIVRAKGRLAGPIIPPKSMVG